MPSHTAPFQPGDYRNAEEARRDTANRVANFDGTAEIVASALRGETYGESLS